MRKSQTKVISIILSILLIFSLGFFSSFATDTAPKADVVATVTTAAELKAAFANQATNIVMGCDIELNDNVAITVSGTSLPTNFDLKGHTLTVSGDRTTNLFKLDAKAQFILKDSTPTGGGKIIAAGVLKEHLISLTGTTSLFTLESGSIVVSDISTSKSAIYVGSGSLAINGGKIETLTKTDGRAVHFNNASGTFTMTDGEILSKNTTGGNYFVSTVYVQAGTIDFDGGTIKSYSDATTSTHALKLGGTSKTNSIESVTLSAESSNSNAFALFQNGGNTITELTNSTLTATSPAGTVYGIRQDSGGIINAMKGCALTATNTGISGGTNAIYQENWSSSIDVIDNCKLTAHSKGAGLAYSIYTNTGKIGAMTNSTLLADTAGNVARGIFAFQTAKYDNLSITNTKITATSSLKTATTVQAIHVAENGTIEKLGEGVIATANITDPAATGNTLAIYVVGGIIYELSGGSYSAKAGLKSTGSVNIPSGKAFVESTSGTWTIEEKIISEENAVASIGTALYEDFNSAVAAARDGDTIKMLKDVTYSDGTQTRFSRAGEKITLDLNGHTLINTKVYALYSYGCDLTIVNGTIESTVNHVIYADADATTDTASSITVNNVTLTGGKDAIRCNKVTTLNVENSILNGGEHGVYLNTVADCQIKGSKVSGGKLHGIYVNTTNKSTVIENSTIEGNTFGIYNNLSTILSLKGGSSAGSIAGVYTAPSKKTTVAENTVMFGSKATDGAGTIIYPTGYKSYTKDASYTENPAKWILSKEDPPVATAVAEVNGTKYTTFKAAFDAAIKLTTPVTVKMLSDYSESITATLTIPAGKDVSLDMNNHSLVLPSATGAHTFVNNGYFTIKDESQEKNGSIEGINVLNNIDYMFLRSDGNSKTTVKDIDLTITGAGYGIYTTTNATLENFDGCNLTAPRNALYAYGPITNGITNSTLTSTLESGLVLKGATAIIDGGLTNTTIDGYKCGIIVETKEASIASLSNCKIKARTAYGVQVLGSIGTIENTDIDAKQFGILLETGGKIDQIIDSTSSSDYHALRVRGPIQLIRNSTFTTKNSGDNFSISIDNAAGKIKAIEGSTFTSDGTCGFHMSAGEVGTMTNSKVTGKYGMLLNGGTNFALIDNCTITGTGDTGLRLRIPVASIRNSSIKGAGNSYGLYIDDQKGKLANLEGSQITGGDYGIYMTTGNIGNILGPTTKVIAENVRQGAGYGFAIYMTGVSTIDKIHAGEFTGTNNSVAGNGTGAALYVNSASASVKDISGGTFYSDLQLPNGTTFKGLDYGIYNKGTLKISGADSIVGTTAAVRNIGKDANLTVTGGNIGDDTCKYGIYNQVEGTNRATISELSGGDITGQDYAVYNEVDITSVSGGAFHGKQSGIYNTDKGIIHTFSGITKGDAKYGVENAGKIETINGGTYSGQTAGILISTGTVNTIQGAITIADAKYGIAYSSLLSTLPGGYNGSNISGASVAQYKDYGSVPTVVSGGVYAHGISLTVNPRPEDPDVGSIISWKNEVLGSQSVDTGTSNWSIYGGGKQKEIFPQKDFKITMNGGRVGRLFAGGNGSSYLNGKITIDINGGTLESLHGGGNFDSYIWGYADYGKGWARVKNVIINLNKPCKIGWYIGLGGRGVSWVDKGELNIHAPYNGAWNGVPSRIHMAGEADANTNDNMDKFRQQHGYKNPDVSIDDMVELIKTASFAQNSNGEFILDQSGNYTPNPEGVGSVILDATVNLFDEPADFGGNINGGNTGSFVDSYTGKFTVNVAEGVPRAPIVLGGQRGHIQDTKISVSGKASITGAYLGSATNIDVVTTETGAISTFDMGKSSAPGTGTNPGWNGGLTSDAKIVYTGSEATISTGSGTNSKSVHAPNGNLNFSLVTNTNYDSISEGSIWWGKELLIPSYSKAVTLEQNGLLMLDGSAGTSTNAWPDGKHKHTIAMSGMAYIYNNLIKSCSESPDAIKYDSSGKPLNNTIIAGKFDGVGSIAGITGDDANSIPTPATAELKGGILTVTDTAGNPLSNSDWKYRYMKNTDTSNFADPSAYVSFDRLNLTKGTNEMYFTATKGQLTIFGKCQLQFDEEEIGEVEVTVGDGQNPVADALVEILRGETLIASRKTDQKGKVGFSTLPYGAYNLVVHSKDKDGKDIITTTAILIKAPALNVNVKVPSIRLNTVVNGDVASAVDGLENAIPESEKNQITNSGGIGSTSEITVTLKTESEAATAETPQKILGRVDPSKITLTDFVDITLMKNVVVKDATGETGTTTQLGSSTQLLTIYLPISKELRQELDKAKLTPEKIVVWRDHNGTITQLAKGSESARNECYYIANVRGEEYVALRVDKFSTYALGVDKEVFNPTPPPGPGPGPGPGPSPDNRYTIKASASSGGTITPSGNVEVKNYLDAKFKINAKPGYVISYVLVDGKKVGAVKSYTFKTVIKDHTIKAAFKRDLASLKKIKLIARSRFTSNKSVHVYWWALKGTTKYLDGYEVFRSKKLNSGYGKKPYYTTKKTYFINSHKTLKKGNRYHYRVRGYMKVGNKKHYTGWSLRAWRTIR